MPDASHPQLLRRSADSDPAHALERFVHQEDRAYHWELRHAARDTDGTYFEIDLVSQQWRTLLWKHRLLFFQPEHVRFPDIALLVLRVGHSTSEEKAALRTAASATGTACAFLFDVPNQPLFGGKEEDELLSFTFSRYLKTGDYTWPLLFPMTKSVVRAMDALQALSRSKVHPTLRRFIIAGHSKRGHTAWLSAVADRRVQGIIPVAIDTLNAPAQIRHHREVMHGLSGPVAAFTETIDQAKTPRGRSLIQMIDPYSYRTRLTLPKLLVLATNDEYYPADALNLYWEGLPGPKWIRYLPNASHAGADAYPGVNATAFAFVRAVAAKKPLASLRWGFRTDKGHVTAQVTARADVASARLWVAFAPTRNFAAAQWNAQLMSLLRENAYEGRGTETTYSARVRSPERGYVAIFAEMEMQQGAPGVQEGQGRERFVLSSQVHISGKA